MRYLITILLIISTNTFAANRSEKSYQQQWCPTLQGSLICHLADNTVCDCLTATHTWEFDRAPKWYEGIGQSLHYARVSGKRAGIVLIVGPKDQRYLDRMTSLIDHYSLPIDIKVVPK